MSPSGDLRWSQDTFRSHQVGICGPNISFVLTFVHSGAKLGSGQSIVFLALLTSPDQCINCYVMCDGIGRDTTSHPVATINLA
jgi:hypothetical protein